MSTLISFGQYLQVKREKLGLNLTEAAKRLGTSLNNLSSWEKDRSKPKGKRMQSLISLYGLTEDDLLAYKTRIDMSDEKITIEKIIRDIKKAKLKIESIMIGMSEFEKRIKAKGMTALSEAQNLLSQITIIDEVLK